MKELKDIVLKKGDVVYLEEGIERFVVNLPHLSIFEGEKAKNVNFLDKIIKIERPVKYETIYETPKEILDKEEKEYLEAVCRPFKNRVRHIVKRKFERFYIKIFLKDDSIMGDFIVLPYFEADTMYKGMELDKEYTLKELGLFE